MFKISGLKPKIGFLDENIINMPFALKTLMLISNRSV